MSYHVFTATRGGACAHMGEYPDHGAARAAWTLARPAGAIVTNATGVVLSTTSTTPPALRTALESFARSFLAAPASTPAAPPAPTPAALRRASRKAFSQGVVSPEDWPTDDVIDEDHIGVGATTEPPRCRTTHHDDCDCQRDARGEPRVEAPLPVPFEPPVIEPARDTFAERAASLRAEIARGIPSADVEHLRVQLAEATARAVTAEDALVNLAIDAEEQTGKLRVATEALATIAKALRIPAHRDPAEIAQRALASIKTYALDAKVQGAEIERLREVIVELHEENKKLHAKVKRRARGTTKAPPRVVETPVEFFHRYIRERAAGVACG